LHPLHQQAHLQNDTRLSPLSSISSIYLTGTQSTPFCPPSSHDHISTSSKHTPPLSPSSPYTYQHTQPNNHQAHQKMDASAQEKPPAKLTDLLQNVYFDVSKAVKCASFSFSIYGE
jgi:hypothetical protein